MKQDSSINQQKLLESIANRIIRMFLGYNSYLHKNLPEDILNKLTSSAKEFYKQIYLPEKEKIILNDLINNWRMVSTTPDIPFIFMGWDEFTKKMEA